MTDVPGVLRDKDDVATKFNALNIRECRQLTEDGIIAGDAANPSAKQPRGICACAVLLRELQAQSCSAQARRHARVPLPPDTLPASLPLRPRSATLAGGMIPKVQCCIRCLSQGVNAAHIIDGRSRHSVLMELLTDEVRQRVCACACACAAGWLPVLAATCACSPPHAVAVRLRGCSPDTLPLVATTLPAVAMRARCVHRVLVR